MKAPRKLTALIACSIALAFLFCTGALAQDEAPIKITLTAEKTAFSPGEPIKLQVRVFNDTIADAITRERFFGQNFYTLITFTDPDGLTVVNKYKDETDEPGPSDIFGERPAAVAEIVPPLPGGERLMVLDDAREFYDLSKYGRYCAQVLVPLETFSTYDQDEQGILYAYLDDPDRKGYDPLASNKICFELLASAPVGTSVIHVKVAHLKIGQETRPKTTKTPLEYVQVLLIPQSDIPQDFYPINHKTYSVIWAWANGSSSSPEIVTSYTDNDGIAKFFNVPQNDYLVLAFYDESQDFKHMGSPIPADDPDWLTDLPIEKFLMVMEKFNGKKVAGKTKRYKGSDLLITEPEFVLWDSEQEQYPFVFESVGDWDVITSVAPPEGFTTDYKDLDAEVNNELEAVQFTITDVGSQWKETEVKYKIKHKGKTKTIKSKIGVKLSKKLQKKKGLGPYGHTKHPGPFKGGKKVGHEKQAKKE
ncbi:MAG: hypothetical protein JRJ82_20580 [Deltaproteobacteria bacterium]|nr:hypothetical protein [Deltaproteobacteria bacterium]